MKAFVRVCCCALLVIGIVPDNSISVAWWLQPVGSNGISTASWIFPIWIHGCVVAMARMRFLLEPISTFCITVINPIETCGVQPVHFVDHCCMYH